MGDFDRNAGRTSSSRGNFGRGRSGGFRGRDRGDDSGGFRGRDRGDDSGGFRGRDRGRRSGRPEMHQATCDKCGKDCEVPFRPTQGKPLYCDDCFKDKNMEAGSRSEMGKPSSEYHDQINKKLDKILKILEGHVKEEVKPKKEIKEKANKIEGPKLEYAESIEEPEVKKPKKKKAKKKKS